MRTMVTLLNIVSAQDFGQLFTVIHRVELGTADKRDAVPRMKSLWKSA